MEKKIDGHLVGFVTAEEWEDYEDHVWLGGSMSEVRYNAYDDTPSKKECDRLAAEQSGDVIIYKNGRSK